MFIPHRAGHYLALYFPFAKTDWCAIPRVSESIPESDARGHRRRVGAGMAGMWHAYELWSWCGRCIQSECANRRAAALTIRGRRGR